VAGIVDPGHSSYKEKRSLRLALSAQADPLSRRHGRAEKLLPQEMHITSVSNFPHPAVKNLAGFDRGFRFTQQKHICATAKQETPHGRRNQKPKTQRKIYETQPQQIRGRFTLCMCGHHLLAHDGSKSSRTGESGDF
jgi:hypothetical protein